MAYIFRSKCIQYIYTDNIYPYDSCQIVDQLLLGVSSSCQRRSSNENFLWVSVARASRSRSNASSLHTFSMKLELVENSVNESSQEPFPANALIFQSTHLEILFKRRMKPRSKPGEQMKWDEMGRPFQIDVMWIYTQDICITLKQTCFAFFLHFFSPFTRRRYVNFSRAT